MSSYRHAAVAVNTSAELLCTVAPENDGAIVQNTGSADAFLGGPGVQTTGATTGVKLPAGQTILVPSVGGLAHDLYAVCATSTTLVYLFPEGS